MLRLFYPQRSRKIDDITYNLKKKTQHIAHSKRIQLKHKMIELRKMRAANLFEMNEKNGSN